MSEYETTDLGGDPVEFEFVEGGTYERGVIRSTADRQQIRRNAEDGNLTGWKIVLELLAELEQAEQNFKRNLRLGTEELREQLEQAERERDESREIVEHLRRHGADWVVAKFEARLAAVPALVEAVRKAVRMAPLEDDDRDSFLELRDALAAWDKQ